MIIEGDGFLYIWDLYLQIDDAILIFCTVIAMEGDGFWTDILRNRVSNKIDGELAGLDDLEIPRMQETQYGVKDCMVLFSGDRQRSSSCW